MTSCEHIDELRDYALGELTGPARNAIERHIHECAECAAELDALRFTTAALRSVPDREAPRRIGFVSDPIFGPSPAMKWFGRLWNPASACILAAGMIVAAYHRPAVVPAPAPVAQAGLTKSDVDNAIAEAVAKAVDRVRAEVRSEDAAESAKALAAADEKHEQEHRALMVAMEEDLTILQKRLSTYTMLASADLGGGR